MFFYLFTKRENPFEATINIHDKVKINLNLLDKYEKNIDTILYIDLIKKMVQEEPTERDTCKNLIDHVVFMGNKERLEVVHKLAEKCMDKDFIEIIDRNKVHMKRSLSEESAEFKALLDEILKFPDVETDIKICSSILDLFQNDEVNMLNYKHLLIFLFNNVSAIFLINN